MQFMWDALTCDCGSIKFLSAVELRWRKEGGLVSKPTGRHVCVECHKEVDTADLIASKQRAQRRQALDELEAEDREAVRVRAKSHEAS